MVPVNRKPPIPRFLDLNRGNPGFPPSLTRRKKFTNAKSRSRSASCGAHLETSYIQGTLAARIPISERVSRLASFLALDGFKRPLCPVLGGPLAVEPCAQAGQYVHDDRGCGSDAQDEPCRIDEHWQIMINGRECTDP